ncbi:MAG TPA: phosphatidylglycerol lysyltransferase domain-containing protein [Candidatus Paceibacterota bacterium]|jgi:hypothetical protein
MIPTFPQFKPLSLEDNDEVEARTRHFPYYSDYNFSSLWCWDVDRVRELSVLDDNLVVKFSDYETGDPFLSFLGMANTTKTAQTLMAYAASIGLDPALRLMPEVAVHDMHPDELQVTADFANFDYVYLASRIAAFPGNQYRSKRQAAEFFMRTHPNHSFEVRRLGEPGVKEDVCAIVSAWGHRKGIADDQSSAHEVEAINNLFSLAEMRDLLVGMVRTDGVPTSFTIEEVVNHIFSIGHFWKTAGRVDGEYDFLARSMARYLCEREVVYLNWEQDLGIESLRYSKSSYRPSDFLKKFTVAAQPTLQV